MNNSLNWKDFGFWTEFDENLNKHYLNRYINFLKSIQNKERELDYSECHHIVPKSFIKNEEIILLTAREHYIAHHVLARIFTNNYGRKMMYAFGKIIYDNKHGKITAKVYEEHRLLRHKFGHSEETKKKMRIKAQKRVYSEEEKKKHAEHLSKVASNTKGTKYMNNGVINERVKPENFQEYLNNGFVFGRLDLYGTINQPGRFKSNSKMFINNGNKGRKLTEEQKKAPQYNRSGKDHPMYGRHQSEKCKEINSLKHKGKIVVNDGIKNKYINKEELDEYLLKGFVKGQVPRKRSKRGSYKKEI